MTASEVLDDLADVLGIRFCDRPSDDRRFLGVVRDEIVSNPPHEVGDCVAVAAEYETEGR